jgi:predicted phage terminase large subunit-like protein
MAKKWSGHVLIEAKANGDAVLSVLASKVSGLIAVDPQGGKFSRASAIAGLFEAGNVYLPANLAWVDEFITDELLRFPRCSHDDRVDAMTQALTYLHQNTNYLQAAMREVRKYLGRVDL